MNSTAPTLAIPGATFRWRPFRLAEFLATGFFALVMGLPLFFLFTGSFDIAPPGREAVYGMANWVGAFSDPSTVSALWMSFLLSLIRLIPAIILPVLFAWLIAQTDMPTGREEAREKVWSILKGH